MTHNFLSIMIVDDNEADRYLLKKQIQEGNIPSKIFEADDGQSAIETLKLTNADQKDFKDKNLPPKIIFLDINMPLVSGFQFLEKFQKFKEKESSSNFSSTVFLMCTTSERKEDIQRALKYQFVKDYIVKGSLSSEELKKKILNAAN